LQDSGFTFTSLDEFLNKVSPKLYKASQKSLRYVLEEEKFSSKIINEMASIACLANYGQTINVDGFVGLVSLAGVSGDLWAIKNGNYLVPQELLKKSGATIIFNANIKLICKDKTNESKNMIVYENEEGNQIMDNTFDYVLIGFPIYSGILGENFQLDFDTAQFDQLKMQLTNTYFIYGTAKLFNNLPHNKHIQLHSVDPSIPYRTVCVNLPCDYSIENDSNLYLDGGNKLYKVFSEEDLDKETFDKVFEDGYKIITEMPWLAYPKYQENPKFKVIPDIILDGSDRSRVFYLNALEWSSSCMEICSISARNVSLIIGAKESSLRNKMKINYSNAKGQEFNQFLHKICGLFSLLSIAAFLLSIYFNK
jgi:prenylcysteine oxidase / farnesylcysteine lyase